MPTNYHFQFQASSHVTYFKRVQVSLLQCSENSLVTVNGMNTSIVFISMVASSKNNKLGKGIKRIKDVVTRQISLASIG